ncbi:hypothetical protein TTHERM_00716000 (macronuclear) [Tetrahymena thermophila SB210]|uniref:Uncharacterized protein n=1 Tax=Tetrahymena thermophila (strain SB210) TaxID=312017 RepID=I7M652_TETTS|nr:hypothetical protein TTHERM_00716000 [Tetrahymena thermophila SB210]EAR84294.4 hypothetical protein TTHERM_00716000 [Tetrahymena thermophila SB210]|eukprot:XP_001031957.4 hypothetical protein TTHERM_00716000 [Tetrahymena thermophila SB210]
MIETENYLSPIKRVDHFSKKGKYSKDLIDMHKILEEKDLFIIKLQKQLSEANKQIILNKNEKSEFEKKLQLQEEYIQKCQKIISQYESLLQQHKSLSLDKKLQLPSIQNSQICQDLTLQGSQIQSSKKKNKFEADNESFKENKSYNSRIQVEKKHFETSTESLSFQEGSSPRNIQLDTQHGNQQNINYDQQMTKSEQKPVKKKYYIDEQNLDRNNFSNKFRGMNRSLIQQTNHIGSSDSQQQIQFQNKQNGSESLNARDRNKKQIQQGNLRNSLQDIYLNFNGNFYGNKQNNLVANNSQLSQLIKGNYEQSYQKDNIFSRQNQNSNYLKQKQLESQPIGQIKSTPDLSLIKLPISKLQKVESKEIKRRINLKVEQKFLN